MGLGLAQRLSRGGHQVVGFAPSAETRARAQDQGIEVASSVEALVGAAGAAAYVWIMVPAGEAVDQTLAAISPLLAQGDTVIDGGNSNYKDTQRRGRLLSERAIDYIDCGTSGGVWGLEQGYSLMIGGDETATSRLRPIFARSPPRPTGDGHGSASAVPVTSPR